MSKIVTICLGEATALALQEDGIFSDGDEVYPIGAVIVKDKSGRIIKDKSMSFQGVGGTTGFSKNNETKQLSPSGVIYQQELPDDSTIEILFSLIEEDGGKIASELLEKYDKKIAEISKDIAKIIGTSKAEGYSGLARLALELSAFILSLIDPEDLLGEDRRVFSLKRLEKKWKCKKTFSFRAQADKKAKYDVKYVVKCEAEVEVSALPTRIPFNRETTFALNVNDMSARALVQNLNLLLQNDTSSVS